MSNVEKSNVENLRNDLDIMSTPHAKTGKTNLWDVAVSINRTNPVPLDKSSIIFEDDVTTTEGETTITIPGTKIEDAAKEATAYPGQIISGLGGTNGTVYVLQPDDHEHDTHIANAGTELTYSDQTQTEAATYEELALQSTVDYEINKEAYQRQVANNARKNTEAQIAKFILENAESVEIQEDGSLTLKVPAKRSDQEDTRSTTVLGYIVETVGAEKTVREQATKDLATFIGTNVSIADAGDTILSDLTLPETLSDRTPNTAATLLEYIQRTVDAEVQKRYQQDLVLLDCINNLDLQRAVSIEETTQDGILTLNLEAKLRDSSSDIVEAEEDSENMPLRKYNN